MSITNIKSKIIIILGPNASGKSTLAVELARKLALSKVEGLNGAEIISADSRQVYKGMDIGTGKVPIQKRIIKKNHYHIIARSNNNVMRKKQIINCYKGILHYLLDVASPKKRFTVAQYKKIALAAIKKIQRKGKIPIICGGSGFYIQAITDNLQIPEVKPDFKLRTKLEKKSADELFKELNKVDPRRAKQIDRFNKRRLIRALEIIYKSGKPVPVFKTKPQFDVLFIGIQKSPQELKGLIHKRLLKRFRQGMIKEVETLRKSGLSWKRLDSFGLEYRWIARYLQKKISRKEMILRLQKDIEHFAKRQMMWFKRNEIIHWIKNPKKAQKLVKKFLK